MAAQSRQIAAPRPTRRRSRSESLSPSEPGSASSEHGEESTSEAYGIDSDDEYPEEYDPDDDPNDFEAFLAEEVEEEISATNLVFLKPYDDTLSDKEKKEREADAAANAAANDAWARSYFVEHMKFAYGWRKDLFVLLDECRDPVKRLMAAQSRGLYHFNEQTRDLEKVGDFQCSLRDFTLERTTAFPDHKERQWLDAALVLILYRGGPHLRQAFTDLAEGRTTYLVIDEVLANAQAAVGAKVNGIYCRQPLHNLLLKHIGRAVNKAVAHEEKKTEAGKWHEKVLVNLGVSAVTHVPLPVVMAMQPIMIGACMAINMGLNKNLVDRLSYRGYGRAFVKDYDTTISEEDFDLVLPAAWRRLHDRYQECQQSRKNKGKPKFLPISWSPHPYEQLPRGETKRFFEDLVSLETVVEWRRFTRGLFGCMPKIVGPNEVVMIPIRPAVAEAQAKLPIPSGWFYPSAYAKERGASASGFDKPEWLVEKGDGNDEEGWTPGPWLPGSEDEGAMDVEMASTASNNGKGGAKAGGAEEVKKEKGKVRAAPDEEGESDDGMDVDDDDDEDDWEDYDDDEPAAPASPAIKISISDLRNLMNEYIDG